MLALIPGFIVPPDNGSIGVCPTETTTVLALTPENVVIATLQLPDVAEYGPIINVCPVEQLAHGEQLPDQNGLYDVNGPSE